MTFLFGIFNQAIAIGLLMLEQSRHQLYSFQTVQCSGLYQVDKECVSIAEDLELK